jgi:amino acid adenylation domain-containing protein
MLHDTQVPVLLAQERLLGDLPEFHADMVCLDAHWETIAQGPVENPSSGATPDNLAYVMYTSGSTGTPKGVEVCHRGIVRLLFGVDYVHLDAARSILHMAPISFDASTFEVWGALLHGSRCVIFPDRIPTMEMLSHAIREHDVSTMWLTASLFNTVIDEAPDLLAGVKQLLIGGEALSVDHVRRALDLLPSTQIINGYGPTESTTFACCYQIPRQLGDPVRSIPIGRPIGNTEVYLLDSYLRPVPIGVAGELHIGGAGLARGYLSQPQLTDEKFIPNPFSHKPGERLYKTGDLARYLPDGNIEFLGRFDQQVKIRGFRIELGEIEVVLGQHPAVREAVVLAREDMRGDKRLAAYVVPHQGYAPDISELRSFLEHKLPEYMVPPAFVLLDALPLTPSGKVDRNALPAPYRSSPKPEKAYVTPENELEQTIADIWRELLEVEKVSSYDNFFDLGGHSLLMTRVHGRLSQVLGIHISIVDLFRYPTVNALAKYISQEPTAEDEQSTFDSIRARARKRRSAIRRRDISNDKGQ